ncbi:hypothetical protein COLO4_36857 [Corchorus olitorius]|uniref:DUF7745 domain-containing protein n=1 Tax=Corchorus olitorius TaxID=93759 RepID=A0A1R3G4S3_9ROSI|nr:hypothetical protein COLO4_36857 [Corchorus olitorius]
MDKGKAPVIFEDSQEWEQSGEELREEIQRRQMIEGDCLVEGFESELPNEAYIDTQENDLTQLRNLWEQVKDKDAFRARYGDIADLLYIKVDHHLLKAMLYSWDSSYRCFVFGEVDMVLTEEEYLDLLKVPVGDLGKFYWRNFQTQVQKKMTAIIGIKNQTWGEQLRELKRLNPNST